MTERKPASAGNRRASTSRTSRPSTSRASMTRASASKQTGKRPAAKKAPASRPAAKPRAAAKPASRPKADAPRRYRRTVRLPIGRTSVRIRVFMVLVAVLLGTAGARAIQLQGIDSQAYADTAAKKMQSTKDLTANRGAITDRNGVVLAATEPAMLISMDPHMVFTNGADERYRMTEKKQAAAKASPGAIADILVKHLGGRKQTYLDMVGDGTSKYKVVARQIPANTWVQIQADMKAGLDGDGKRPLYGLFATSDPVRTYPNRTVASNVLGFVNAEGKGAAGLEYVLNDKLTGTPGKQVYDSSTYGRIPLGTSVMEPAVDGDSYVLTLDSDLQWMSEQALAQGMKTSGAKTGKLIVLNVKTGEILALANGPSYDSANPGSAKSEDLGNRAVTEAYEPGSVQKVLTMAALADQGLVTPDTEVVVPPSIASGDGVVRDSYTHGTINLTARGIIANSSNIGTIQLTRTMDKGKLSDYLSSFGLGTKSNVGLPGETTGRLPGGDMADYTRDQIAFGQGLSVNAVQMAAAVAAAINGGTYHQPTIIKSATKADGSEVELPARESHRVVSEEASKAVVEMMESVVTLKDNRAIDGYRTIGKSGTAQRFDPKCKCYNGFTASYVGAAPAEDPQLLVYVVLDQPTNGNLGSQLALPVVNDVLKLALPRYNVAPSTTLAPELPLTFE